MADPLDTPPDATPAVAPPPEAASPHWLTGAVLLRALVRGLAVGGPPFLLLVRPLPHLATFLGLAGLVAAPMTLVEAAGARREPGAPTRAALGAWLLGIVWVGAAGLSPVYAEATLAAGPAAGAAAVWGEGERLVRSGEVVGALLAAAALTLPLAALVRQRLSSDRADFGAAAVRFIAGATAASTVACVSLPVIVTWAQGGDLGYALFAAAAVLLAAFFYLFVAGLSSAGLALVEVGADAVAHRLHRWVAGR